MIRSYLNLAEALGESGAESITNLWIHDDELRLLAVAGGSVATTSEHPFWNAGERIWQSAEELDAGDALLANDGKRVVVRGLGASLGTKAAYNLTVANFHTYYVLAGNTPVLVHNTDGCWRGSFDNLPTGKQPHVRTVGSEEELRDVFGQMTNGAEQLPARGPKIPEVYRRADGTVIQWRGASRSGGATIDIFPPNSKGLKVHVEEP
ncbi:polymorphic toxin-type HINT domain-containing protein [Micromonospora sp. HUAS YX12]|uniref:Polymorphic toxin-type HINT domain-containing protein n=1 Tax=Micromonospora sp. HUAS YX12 TaxID=3156396 RepID=A0AAU7R2X4_9ACTN